MIFLATLVIFIEDPELRDVTTQAAMYWMDQGVIRSWCITDDRSRANVRIKSFPANIRAPRAFFRITLVIEVNRAYRPNVEVMKHELGHIIFMYGD